MHSRRMAVRSQVRSLPDQDLPLFRMIPEACSRTEVFPARYNVRSKQFLQRGVPAHYHHDTEDNQAFGKVLIQPREPGQISAGPVHKYYLMC